ncbi:MarR family winged helix-turn-helix transcriptional regulator [Heliophilum fasciatum]|nr:MarR family transcriptional regulator [Heliophilum fasciatum]MCW2279421.1 DNA-binding MarR family transcriptional regulator [Heliophilum fasciatum]
MSRALREKEQPLIELLNQIDGFFYCFRQAIKNIEPDMHLAEGQILLLYVLWKNGPYKATEISNELCVTSGAVTGMTDKLFGMGLLNRERSDIDRRVVMLSLTDKGMELIRGVHQRRLELLKEPLQILEATELVQLSDMFRKLNAYFAQSGMPSGKMMNESKHNPEVTNQL